jgi:integrase
MPHRIAHPKPPQKRKEIPDTEIGGLYKIAQPSGKESFGYRYRFHGRSRKLTLGDASKLSVKDARLLARKAYLSVANGIDPGEEKKLSRISTRTPVDLDLVEKVVAEFIKRHVPHLATSTQRQVIGIMNRDILPAWRGRKLSAISKADIHILLDRISDRGSPIAANRALAWFRVLCNWGVGRGLVDVNPCNGVARPEPEAPRERVLSDDELAALWDAADVLTRPFGPYVKTLVLTGQRSHEVSDMEWPELDLVNRVWTLPARRAKNAREHTIPLSELACTILESIPRLSGSPFVFTLRGVRPIQGHHLVKRRLDELLPSEMEPWTFHDVRRTVASGMARLGINLPTIEKLLNHISGSFKGIVSVYQRHDYAEEKRRAMALWAQHIADIVIGEADDNIVPIRRS